MNDESKARILRHGNTQNPRFMISNMQTAGYGSHLMIYATDGAICFSLLTEMVPDLLRINIPEAYPVNIQEMFKTQGRQSHIEMKQFDELAERMAAHTMALGYPGDIWSGAIVLRQEAYNECQVHDVPDIYNYETCAALAAHFDGHLTYTQLGICIDSRIPAVRLLSLPPTIPFSYLKTLYNLTYNRR